jgi:hypothetical protein
MLGLGFRVEGFGSRPGLAFCGYMCGTGHTDRHVSAGTHAVRDILTDRHVSVGTRAVRDFTRPHNETYLYLSVSINTAKPTYVGIQPRCLPERPQHLPASSSLDR